MIVIFFRWAINFIGSAFIILYIDYMFFSSFGCFAFAFKKNSSTIVESNSVFMGFCTVSSAIMFLFS
jgi:hypothetical protein